MIKDNVYESASCVNHTLYGVYMSQCPEIDESWELITLTENKKRKFARSYRRR